MAKTTIKDLIKVCKWYRLPLGIVVHEFNEYRKLVKTDREAVEWLIEDLAEGAIS